MLCPHLKAGVHYYTYYSLPYLKKDWMWWVQVRPEMLAERSQEMLKDNILQKDMDNNGDYRCCMFPLSLDARGKQLN